MSPRYTCKALHSSFALPPDQLFDWIEEVPIACGSIGQVHRAQLSEKGAALACCDAGEVVAVKVRQLMLSCCGMLSDATGLGSSGLTAAEGECLQQWCLMRSARVCWC
jgi:hypothetical protein